MSTQRETDAESAKEQFSPPKVEQIENPHPRSLVGTGRVVDDYLGRKAGTDVCFGCDERRPVTELDDDTWFCRVCREAER